MTGLSLFLKNGLIWFAGLADRPELIPSEYGLCILLLILGSILCFIGFKAYRVYFTLLVYTAVVILWCLALKGKISWRNLAAGFSVTGCVMGFFAFRWKTLGAVLIPAVFAGVGAYVLFTNIWAALVVGAVALLLSYGMPVYCVRLATAVFGAFLIGESAGCLWHIGGGLSAAVIILLCLAGLGVQTLAASKLMTDVKLYRGWAKKAVQLREKKSKKESGSESGV